MKKTISPRAAETLSYLQGLGPVGEWVVPSNRYAQVDLGFSKTQVCQYFTRLIRQGYIEERRSKGKFREFRVVLRLEHPDVIQGDGHSFTFEERMAMRAKAWRTMGKVAAEPQRQLVRFSGHDPHEVLSFGSRR